jgi:hypothetical protein
VVSDHEQDSDGVQATNAGPENYTLGRRLPLIVPRHSAALQTNSRIVMPFWIRSRHLFQM